MTVQSLAAPGAGVADSYVGFDSPRFSLTRLSAKIKQLLAWLLSVFSFRRLRKGCRRLVRAALREIHLEKKIRRRCRTADRFVRDNNCQPLSREEKCAIDDYWAQYGVRFRNYNSFLMNYTITGRRDPRFIPDYFAYHVLYPYYNDLTKVSAYADKNKLPQFLPSLRFPTVLGQRVRNHVYDHSGSYCGEEVSDGYVHALYQKIMETDNHDIIIKPSLSKGCGKGLKKYSISCEEDVRAALLDNFTFNSVIQLAIRQHPFFEQFNKSSVNIIRCTSWRRGGQVELFAPCIRFGIPGSCTDVAFRNGKEIVNCVGIGKDGQIFENGVGLDGKPIPLHVQDRQVPCWDEIVAAIRRGHMAMDHFDIIGWDITVDSDGNVVCIEHNLGIPGALVYQFAHGPMAGEHTDEFLSFLKDPEVRRRVLPRSMLIA